MPLTSVKPALQWRSNAGVCGPVGPTGPVVPVVPFAPVGPFKPVGPLAPVAPFGPVGPGAPVGPRAPETPLAFQFNGASHDAQTPLILAVSITRKAPFGTPC